MRRPRPAARRTPVPVPVPRPEVPIETPEQFGAEMFGPVLFAFMVWLMRHPAMRHLDRLYFASREGWALEGLYNALRGPSGIARLPPAVYLHCSRRAVLAAQLGASVAAGRLDPSLLTSSSPWFEGTVEELLRARIGFVAAAEAIPGSRIVLMRDAAIVHCVAELMADEIAPHVLRAHAGFVSYAERHDMLGGGRADLVDVGYSATMQAAIQKTLGIRLVGFYMATTNAAQKVGEDGGYAFGAFAEGAAATRFGGEFGLFLEAVLSAPHGQVIGYAAPGEAGEPAQGEPQGEPLFDTGGAAQRAFATLERIHAGIRAHCLERMATHGLQPDADPFAPLRRLGEGSVKLAAEIRQALFVEDAFCGNGEIDVLARAAAGQAS